jgi:cation-transporting ATPase E
MCIRDSWWAVVVLARPLTALRLLLVGSMLGLFALVLTVPFARDFFAFALPTLEATGVALAVGAAAIVALELLLRVSGWDRRVSPDVSSPPPRADRAPRARVS